MRSYELTIILPEDGEDKQKKVLADLEKKIKSAGGKVEKTSQLGKRGLTYKIGKHDTGIYFFWEIGLPAEAASQLNRELEVDEEVLRHLLLTSRGGKSIKKEVSGARKKSRPSVAEATQGREGGEK